MDDSTTKRLMQRAHEGDPSAAGELVNLHRDRLRRMVTFRLDPRVSARLDASDVIQETLAEAIQKLPTYLSARPIPFYPWLRQIAWQRIVRLHEKHLQSEKRSVLKECDLNVPQLEASQLELARQLVVQTAGPSTILRRDEELARVQKAVEQLRPNHRELLMLRYVEQLEAPEIAAVLNITESAVRMRHLRALERLRELLDDPSEES